LDRGYILDIDNAVAVSVAPEVGAFRSGCGKGERGSQAERYQ